MTVTRKFAARPRREKYLLFESSNASISCLFTASCIEFIGVLPTGKKSREPRTLPLMNSYNMDQNLGSYKESSESGFIVNRANREIAQ
jgi:hypothetical protein